MEKRIEKYFPNGDVAHSPEVGTRGDGDLFVGVWWNGCVTSVRIFHDPEDGKMLRLWTCI